MPDKDLKQAKDVIVALDFPTGDQALAFADRFDRPIYTKVGMELFYSEGPAILTALKERGHRVFLDLKLHDIPNTVKSAMRVLAGYGVDMVNVHAAGTIVMMEAANEGLQEGAAAAGREPAKLIAVTQLTSTDQTRLNEEIGIPGSMESVIRGYAANAMKAGLAGVVCSPLEAPVIHESCGRDFLTVTPGIRFADGDHGDQRRVTTPALARELGSDYIVVGRPITRAEDPAAAYERCVQDFLG